MAMFFLLLSNLFAVVDLLCVLCSRIRTYRHLLLIFFHDKNWFQSDTPAKTGEGGGDDEEEEEEAETNGSPTSPVDSLSTITSAPSAKKPDYEFLLFNYLLRYVHREGRIGDFARAGVLFLIDVAMNAPSGDSRQLEEHVVSRYVVHNSDPIGDAALALAEYILEGDFAEVLAAGLVAVYSVLPSKLEIRVKAPGGEEPGVMSLGASIYEHEKDPELEKARNFGLELSSDPDFQAKLNHFLQIIEFIQDVLRRNAILTTAQRLEASALVGSAISTSVLQGVKTIFLENVLYPSILESSDSDGSAVAVLSYIDMTLQALPEGLLSELFIDFLMNEDDMEANRSAVQMPAPRVKESRLRKRKSSAMMLLELEAPKGPRHSTYFASLGRFTLKDFVFSNLRSTSDAASTAVLQLLQTLLSSYPRLTVDRLLARMGSAQPVSAIDLPTSPESNEEVFTYPSEDAPAAEPLILLQSPQAGTTFATHEREMALYLNLVSQIDPNYDVEGFSTGYDNYLKDAIHLVQSQQDLMMRDADNAGILDQYELNPNDTLLSLMLQALRTFFLHTTEYNVALTGALSCIASCPTRSLAGWMTFSPAPGMIPDQNKVAYLQMDGDGDDRSIDFEIDQQLSDVNIMPAASVNDAKLRPVLYSILRGLVSQLDRYRERVNEFDQLLTERRQGLLFAENLSEALSLSTEFDSSSSFFSTIRSAFSPPPKSKATREAVTPPQSKTLAMAASLVPSFLTPKKDKASQINTVSSSPLNSISERGLSVKLAASPFGAHYEKTRNISVQPLVVLPETEAPSSSETENVPKDGEDSEEGDAHSDQWISKKSFPTVNKVTLSQLLDNVVILEEFMKEMSAIVQARRSLGIDPVRYL